MVIQDDGPLRQDIKTMILSNRKMSLLNRIRVLTNRIIVLSNRTMILFIGSIG